MELKYAPTSGAWEARLLASVTTFSAGAAARFEAPGAAGGGGIGLRWPGIGAGDDEGAGAEGAGGGSSTAWARTKLADIAGRRAAQPTSPGTRTGTMTGARRKETTMSRISFAPCPSEIRRRRD